MKNMTIEEILYPTQKQLFKTLKEMFGEKAISKRKQFILVKGDAPIMLVAHLDTVHKEKVREICYSKDGNIIMSPQGIGGDDRCGVYAILKVYNRLMKAKPWLLFTCDEETGGVGADAFCAEYQKGLLPEALDDLKLIIEIDRRGSTDAVYYDCANKDLEEYITSKGFKTQWGSFSDISFVAPELGVAAVNLSSGYYNAHTQHEYINKAELEAVIDKVAGIAVEASEPDFPTYEYIEIVRPKSTAWQGLYGYDSSYTGQLYGYGKGYDYWSSEDREKDVPDDLPKEYRDMYIELLDYYTKDELELYRKQEGNKFIEELYISDFGDYTDWAKNYGGDSK